MNPIELSSELVLHPLALHDQSAIAQLMRRIYPPAYAHFWLDDGDWYLESCYGIAGFRSDLEGEDSAYYRIDYQGQACGILLLREHTNLLEFSGQSALKLQKLYLGSEVHGLGLATQLMTFVENRARHLRKDLVWLEVMDEQPQAMRFYAKLDYQLLDTVQLDFTRLLLEMRTMWQPIRRLTGNTKIDALSLRYIKSLEMKRET